ncbi:MAG: undecaprenyl/decaprenyl-phosphate alpha-N-acetylglucosaminyl 1-phosphate transferase [Gammaproteobacteria bacterium]|nr:undecaprenyl/decaprenyl-phosphate alpha-N-acetylglucosaminyl 1-phosphate transferase [Gammaproteobacteria bacterium]
MLIEAVFIATLVTVLLILALRPFALAVGLVDRPGGRKKHVGVVPVTGGIAMYFGAVFGLSMLDGPLSSHSMFLLAGGLLALVGVIDDRFHLTATIKLIAQLAAVLIMVFGADLIMRDIGDPLWVGRISLGPMALIVSALIYVTVINAYNFIDGLDGLAGCMALIALLAIAYVAGLWTTTGAFVAVLAAVVVGYLIFNLPIGRHRPFRTFMGDTGSTFLGFSIAWATVSVCQGDARVISPVYGLWFAALPLYDLLTCVVRRSLKGRSPFDPGRDHFHHVLRDADMSARKVAAVLVALQLFYALIAITAHNIGVADPLMFAAWAVLGLSQYAIVRGIADLYRRFRLTQTATGLDGR